MDDQEQKLLEDVTEAENRFNAYRRGVWQRAAGMIISALIFACGIVVGCWGRLVHLDTGGFAWALAVPSFIGIFTCLLWLVNWVDTRGGGVFGAYSRKDDPTVILQTVRRAYREYCLRGGN